MECMEKRRKNTNSADGDMEAYYNWHQPCNTTNNPLAFPAIPFFCIEKCLFIFCFFT